MELEFQQVHISYLQCVLHETIMQEEIGETIVPDSMPDMDCIVDSFAGAIVRGKECQGGTVSLVGDIQAGVLYTSQQEDMPRQISVYLPFSLRRSITAPDGCQSVVECRVRSVDARMLNSRKVSIRVGLCIVLQVYEPRNEMCSKPGQQARWLQMKYAEYPMQLPVECGEKNMLLRDTMPLGTGQPEAARLLHIGARCEITDEKLTGNKAVCKGQLIMRLLYETREQALASAEVSLPFSQFMDLEREYEEQGLRLIPVLTGLEAVAEGDSVTVEAGVNLQCMIHQTVQVPMLRDAYATRGALELQWKSCEMVPRLDSRLIRQELRQELRTEASEVVRAEAMADAPEMEWQEGQCRIKLPVQLRVLYRDPQGQFRSAGQRAEVNVEVPAEKCRCYAHLAEFGPLFAAPAAGGIEMRLPVGLRCDWYADRQLHSICGGSLEEGEAQEDGPAVIIRTLESEGDLWDIAKELRTTVSAIQIANDMEEEVAPAGTMLLIPIVA